MKKIVLLVLCLLVIAACLGIYFSGSTPGFIRQIKTVKVNNDNLKKLKINMPKKAVIEMFGYPERVEVMMLDNQAIEFLFYRTRIDVFFEKDKDANFTPLAFYSSTGKLIGWDRDFYKRISKPSGHQR